MTLSVLKLTLKILSEFFGTAAGESIGSISVNSSAKLLTSISLSITGLNGGETFCLAKACQSIACKDEIALDVCTPTTSASEMPVLTLNGRSCTYMKKH